MLFQAFFVLSELFLGLREQGNILKGFLSTMSNMFIKFPLDFFFLPVTFTLDEGEDKVNHFQVVCFFFSPCMTMEELSV